MAPSRPAVPGYSRLAATRYAFLLAIPAVFGSGVQARTRRRRLRGLGADDPATLIAGFGRYAVIAWLLRYITTHSFTPFVLYRLGLAVLLAVLLLTGYLDPQAPIVTGCVS